MGRRQNFAVNHRQFLHSGGHQFGTFARNHNVNGGRSRVAKRRRRWGKLARVPFIEALRPNAAEMINGQISSQSKQPGIEISPWIKAPDLRGHAQPGLLEEIFRFCRLAHKPKQVTIEPMLIPLHERCEGIQVSASKPRNLGVKPHEHLHRNGSRAYHTLLYTNDAAKKTHLWDVSNLPLLNGLAGQGSA